MPVLRTKTSRMWLPTPARLALLNMLAYHAMYDWVYVFGHESSWYNIWAPGCHVWQQYICWSFILLSGFSFPLAKRPAKNGLIVGGLRGCADVCDRGVHAVGGDLVRRSAPDAAAVLLTCLVYPLLQAPARRRWPGGVCGAVCADEPAARRYLGFENWRLCAVPAGLYRANLFWLGLPDLTRFTSADYFPVVPWVFLFWCGVFLARLWRPGRGEPPAALRPLCAIGRNTLLVYMLHQPVSTVHCGCGMR